MAEVRQVEAPIDPVRSRLEALDRALLADPGALELRHQRAALLAEAGRVEEARAAFLSVIAEDPDHYDALNDFGSLLYRTDFRTAARTVWTEAVRRRPDRAMARINLANALLAEGRLPEAETELQIALRLEPDDPDAHQGMANLLQEKGLLEAAERHRQLSYRGRRVTVLPYRGKGEPRRVLLLVSAVGGNVPTRFILDDRAFLVFVLVVEAHDPSRPLPPHDHIFNAVGDADLCRGALDAAEAVIARSPAPVVNPPARVRLTGRLETAERLGGLLDVRAPRMVRAQRDQAAAAAAAFGFPLLIRSPGFHTGRHFVRVEAARDLQAALDPMPGGEALLIEPLNAVDPEGGFRKYRVMLIGGALFPLHLAVSRQWKVHYFTADMAERPDHRLLEAAFLRDMASVIGPRAMAALGRIRDAVGLDYAGVDFGVDADGALLLFEANATMVINPPPADPIWDYRRPPVEAALAGAQGLMLGGPLGSAAAETARLAPHS